MADSRSTQRTTVLLPEAQSAGYLLDYLVRRVHQPLSFLRSVEEGQECQSLRVSCRSSTYHSAVHLRGNQLQARQALQEELGTPEELLHCLLQASDEKPELVPLETDVSSDMD
jgi:hypothetical protein